MGRLSILCVAAVVLAVQAGTPAASDVVLYASEASARAGSWNLVSDSSAAGGVALSNPDTGAAKLAAPLAVPATYFELTFEAEAGQPYHLWLRGKAQKNSWANDSVFVQFSDSVNGAAPIYRIGTTSATTVTVEDCTSCGLAGWGWQDNGLPGLGAHIVFAASGSHVIRIQPREDGLTIDQVVLSRSTYLSSPPGASKNDTTILPKGTGGGTPPPALVRQPFLQQVTSTSATLVWAARESVPADVLISQAGSPAVTQAATATFFPASVTGMPDYVQYQAELAGLSPSTTYAYTLRMNGVDRNDGADRFTTAPPNGSGTVRFIAWGDSGVGSAQQRALAVLMKADAFDLALHTGDMVYGEELGIGPASYAGYQGWFFDVYKDVLRRRPMFPSIGNHDDATAHGRAYRDVFVLPANGATSSFPDHAERFYSFDYGPVHFTVLDTETAFLATTRRRAQLDWLDADLRTTTQGWKVAVYHRPGYSAGAEHGSDVTVRQAFGPIFEKYGVQLVLNGHDHDYERTLPMKTSTDPAAKPVTYIVSGGGGAPLYTVGSGAWTAAARSAHHYLRAEASACALTIQPIGLDGVAFDSLTLERCTTPVPSSEVVVRASDVPAANIVGADWSLAPDATAAGGTTLLNPDRAMPKPPAGIANPASYVDVPFAAQAGVAYHVWFRMKARSNSIANDSVYVQFSGAVDASGRSFAAIGASGGASVILEDGVNKGVAGWGWADHSYGSLAAPVYFRTAGPQTLRLQGREDGVSIDQIVISPATYLMNPPGAAKNDTTVVAR